ncbi:MAG: tRNA epoxyqueuosine(34) reductase QueG [Pirellulales bacterium]
MLAVPYRTEDEARADGRIAQYAHGADYHKVLWKRLDRLGDALRTWVPAARTRGVVDTAPLLEREFARRAGLGWIGKNTLLLNREHGSWFFLAALILDVELPIDAPFTADHCGTCRACLEACPTHAFVQPYVLDASRCISYLTIETKSSIATELREPMGDWLWGCDVCQDVCPWNSKSPPTEDPVWGPNPTEAEYRLTDLFLWTAEEFAARFRGTVFCAPSGAGCCATRRWSWETARTRPRDRRWNGVRPTRTKSSPKLAVGRWNAWIVRRTKYLGEKNSRFREKPPIPTTVKWSYEPRLRGKYALICWLFHASGDFASCCLSDASALN